MKINLFDKIKNGVSAKINDRIEKNEQREEFFNKLRQESIIFNLVLDNEPVDDFINPGKIEEITEICPNLNKKTAAIVEKQLTPDENIAYIITAKQETTKVPYYIVFSTNRLIIMNDTKKQIYEYSNVSDFQIIEQGFMTQVIFFMNNLIIADTTQTILSNIKRYITESEFHNYVNNERNKYLLGTKPIYQKLNEIKSGISIDSNNNVIFHNKKIENYGYRYQDIKNYELLENDTFLLRKKDDGTKQFAQVCPTKCRVISLKITLIDNQQFSINLLEPTTFNKSYDHNDKKYLKEQDFGCELIAKLDSLVQNN